MNIDSIPQWEEITICSAPGPNTDIQSNKDNSSNAIMSPGLLPLGKRARKRLARKKSGKKDVVVTEKFEMDSTVDENMIDEDLALGWLQLV